MTEKLRITAPTRNWRFSASYDSFVVQQKLVLRMNICGENRQLLVAAKRYQQAYYDIVNCKHTITHKIEISYRKIYLILHY